jgi:hypothetical protein
VVEQQGILRRGDNVVEGRQEVGQYGNVVTIYLAHGIQYCEENSFVGAEGIYREYLWCFWEDCELFFVFLVVQRKTLSLL